MRIVPLPTTRAGQSYERIMANEITLNIKLDYSNAGTTTGMLAATSLNVDVAALGVAKMTKQLQPSGSGEEALDLGDIATPGYFIAVNRGPTDTISIRSATGVAALVDLKPDEACCFRMAGTASAPYVISSGSNNPVLDYLLLED